MSTTQEQQDRITQVVSDLTAKGCEAEGAVYEHDGFIIGEEVRVIEDDDDNGLCEGDTGIVVPYKIGAGRARLSIAIDGYTSPMDVGADNLEGA